MPQASEVVAGEAVDQLHQAFVKCREKVAGEERFHYAICDYCQSYTSRRAEFNQPLEQCNNCNSLSGNNKGTFIIPASGFIASRETPATPGDRRPERTYTTRIHYSGVAGQQQVEIRLKDMTLAVLPHH